ncbi:uncharacterized protein LOC118646328 [Monomorium pharaonis]|uniref:uncharacterized protein LOC118646328 n=1 Tax=Monomorium pharaonis TaxID=307658 RepID=UPI0017468EF3|nr:uncharacterized protein LOC118646328 [Monomorium pharaonis]
MAEEKETRGTSDKVNVIVGSKDCASPVTLKALQLAEKEKLIQESSWTKTVPYKYWHSYVKPTDSIGSIFTPSVNTYRTRTLTRRSVKPARWHPFGTDGVLASPPHILVERHNEELKRKIAVTEEKKRDSLPENIVSLRDLADDTWLRKKSRKTKILMKKELTMCKKKITKQKLDREVTRNVF